jgi:hypothetical protein
VKFSNKKEGLTLFGSFTHKIPSTTSCELHQKDPDTLRIKEPTGLATFPSCQTFYLSLYSIPHA